MTLSWTGRGTCEVTDNSGPHTVDLLSYKAHGKCDCFGYVKYMRPNIEEAIKERRFMPGNPAWRCSHISFADGKLVEMFKQELLKQFGDDSNLEVT